MKRLLISLAFVFALVGSGSKALGPEVAHAQPAVAVDGGAAQPPAAAPTEGAPPRGTSDDSAAPTAGGEASAGTEGSEGETAGDSDSAGELVTQLGRLVQAGKWGAAVGVLLLLIIAGLRTVVLGSWIPWFKTRIGGYVLAFLTAVGAVIGGALAAEVSISLGLLAAAVWAGAGAIGLHQGQKDLRAWWASRNAG